MKIAIVYGGETIESTYSVYSATNLEKVLQEYGFETVMIDLKDQNWANTLLSSQVELMIDLVYGCPGQEGSIKGFAELSNIKYLGSNLFTHALIKDKYLAKLVCLNNGIYTPDFFTVSKHQYIKSQEHVHESIAKKIGFPCVVKPRRLGGLSLGISYCGNIEELKHACFEGFIYDEMLIIEEFIPGTELSVCALNIDNNLTLLPPLQVVLSPNVQICNYETKISGSRQIVPYKSDNPCIDRMLKEQCEKLFDCFDIKDYCYFDFIVNGDKIYFIEAGATPGLTENSNLLQALAFNNQNIGSVFSALIANKMGNKNN